MTEATTTYIDAEELEVISISSEVVAVIDFAEWVPQVHLIEPSTCASRSDLADAILRLGGTVGGGRQLLLREMRKLRVAASKRDSVIGQPNSVLIEADIAAGARIAAGVVALAKARVSCARVTLRSSAHIDPAAIAAAVRQLYGVGHYRVWLTLRDEDVQEESTRSKLIEVLRELWSIQPTIRVRWDRLAAGVLDDPVWGDFATRITVVGYSDATPADVWTRLRAGRCEVVGFEFSESDDRHTAEVKWLIDAYKRDLVLTPESCSPYAEALAALREPRVVSPACVRRSGRRLLVDEHGRATCCPVAARVDDWRFALDGERCWQCAMSWVDRKALGCCNPGRLTRPECSGRPLDTCPDVLCDFARAMLPVLLRRLRDSMVESSRRAEASASA